MARIRTIKPEFPQSESIGRLSRNARLLYVNLITTVDDAGRARGSSRMLASLLYPYDNDAPGLIEDWIQELEQEGCARRYEFEGSTYLDLPNFLKHQKIDKPSQSRLPKFEDGSRVVAKPRDVSAPDLVSSISTFDLGKVSSTGTKDLPVAPQPRMLKRRGYTKIATKDLDADFEVWFAQFPKQDGEDGARTKYRSVRRSFRATAAELLSAAMRYSQQKTGTDPTYIKTAKNWLNDGDWKNPPRAKATNGLFLDVDAALGDYVDGDRHG
jgi:hypothetical protein